MVVPSTLMVSTIDLWTVRFRHDGDWSSSAPWYDPATETMRYTATAPVVLECTHPSKPGIQFEVHGTISATRWHGGEHVDGKPSRTPYFFEMGNYVGIRFVEPPSSDSVNDAGIGVLHRAVKNYWRDMARLDPTFFGAARSLPAPGRKGHNDGHYAVWAKRYFDAVEHHGRGYLAHINQQWPRDYITKSNLHRTLKRSEDLELCVIERTPGRLSTGHMTDKGNALLQKAGQQ